MTGNMEGLAYSDCVPVVSLPAKPRKIGQLELRDRAIGMNELQDIVETVGNYIDAFKSAGGSQRLLTREFLKRKNDYLRQHNIGVSTGGLLERVLLQGERAVQSFLDESAELGFTTVEISTGLAILSLADKAALIEAVIRHGLSAKPEIAMIYGARTGDIHKPSLDGILRECEICLDAGASALMIEEEGIFQFVDQREANLVYALVRKVGLEKLMFEASEPETFNWLIAQFGPDVNLFVDPGYVTNVVTCRAGIWGKNDTWGRVAGFRGVKSIG